MQLGGWQRKGERFTRFPKIILTVRWVAYTHNIALSPEREKETEQTLKMMFDLGL